MNMKKIFIALAFSQLTIAAINAQQLVKQVPAKASVVIKYAGNNLSKKLPVNKADTYNFIKSTLLKALKTDSIQSINDIGIDFEKDTYQYVDITDSAINFVSLINLQNEAAFLRFITALKPQQVSGDKKTGYQFLAISDNSYLGWNKQLAVIVNTTYTPKSGDYYAQATTADSAVVDITAMTDSATVPATNIEGNIEQEKAMEAAKKAAEEAVKAAKKKTVTKSGKAKKPGVKKKAGTAAPQKKKKPQHEPTEEEMQLIADEMQRVKDSIETAKRDEWYMQQQIVKVNMQKNMAENIANNFFNGNLVTASIENDSAFKELVNNTADISLLLDYDNIFSQYSKLFSGRILHQAYPPMDGLQMGIKAGINLYFDKDKVRLESDMFSKDASLSQLVKKMYDNKQSQALTGLVNPDNIAYLSMSMNMEAMENYYYQFFRKYLSNMSYTKEYADIIDAYIDLMEIVIDEKAIAELVPGNFMMVLHSVESKTVTYKDYEYDKDFNKTEVEKTKTEIAPNFSIAMETKNEKFLQKLVNLPLKYAEKGKYNYKKVNDYYILSFDPKNNPIEKLYFLVKNGVLLVTTSIDCINNSISGKSFATEAGIKNSIMNNNYSAKLNSKKLIESIGKEFSADTNKKMVDWLQQNLGDFMMESGLKDGKPHSTASFNVVGEYPNSLQYLFNMIDSLNNIIQNDKKDKEEANKIIQ